MRAPDWVWGWCNVLGLGEKETPKKWGFPLGLPRIVLWGAQGWSSRLVLCLWSVLGCSHRGPPHIVDSWIVSPGLSSLVFAQNVPLRPVCHPPISGARMHHLARNPECRAEHTSLDCVFVLCPTSIW